MKILLDLLAGVALLVWGTHLVRTDILRLYGGDLRRVLRQSVANRFKAFGADLGTSLMVLLFSFDLSWLSPFLIFTGVVLFLRRENSKVGRFGRILIGLGLIMMALQWIVLTTKPITQAAGVKVIFASLTGDVLLDML